MRQGLGRHTGAVIVNREVDITGGLACAFDIDMYAFAHVGKRVIHNVAEDRVEQRVVAGNDDMRRHIIRDSSVELFHPRSHIIHHILHHRREFDLQTVVELLFEFQFVEHGNILHKVTQAPCLLIGAL